MAFASLWEKIRPFSRHRATVLALLLITSALLIGCEMPSDPEDTLDRVRASGILRAGIAPNPPWIIHERGEPRGFEARIIDEFARSLGARVRWTRGSEAVLVEALEGFQLDLMAGGLTDSSPWKRRLGVSRPWRETTVIVAVAKGHPADRENWRGVQIGYPPDRPHFAAFIAEAGADPVPGEKPAMAVYAFEAAPQGLSPTSTVLRREQRLLAVAPGESAFLLALDRFLAARRTRSAGENAP